MRVRCAQDIVNVRFFNVTAHRHHRCYLSRTLAKTKRFVERHSMLTGMTGIVVAVSGGPDSIALLDLLSKLLNWVSARREFDAEAAATNAEARLVVAHLDHCLRGEESREDSEFVRAIAEELQLPYRAEARDIAEAARAARRSIEDTARRIRYEFLLRIARETGCNRIATGHTMNDQAETVLLRLARGAGASGLAGIRPVVPAHLFGEIENEGSETVLLIRPLLCLTRAEIEDYCNANALQFRCDRSNEDLAYTRNRLRKTVLPPLAKINPRIVQSIYRASRNIAEDQDALEAITKSVVERSKIESSPAVSDGPRYSVSELRASPPAIRKRAILRILGRAGADMSVIGSSHVHSVENILMSPSSGKRVVLPGDLVVWRELDEITIRSTGLNAQPNTELDTSGGLARIPGFLIESLGEFEGQRYSDWMDKVREHNKRQGGDWMGCLLDSAALPRRLNIRPRLSGERAVVIGQRSAKKLKNLMIDHRIPVSLRALWPVVASPDNIYIWSPGLPPAIRFVPTECGRSFVVLTASRL